MFQSDVERRSPATDRVRVRRGAIRAEYDRDAILAVLDEGLVSDHVVATWDTGRTPTEGEIRRTMVIAVPLVETSAKIRTGDPADEPDDIPGPHWGGHVPIRSVWETPVAAKDLPGGVEPPPAIAALGGVTITRRRS